MYEIVLNELKFWRIALRESYHLELITEDQLFRMHRSDYYENLNSYAYTECKYIELVFSLMNDSDLFANLMIEEANILFKGIIPTDKQSFKKIWLSYLLECLNDNYINESQFNIYYSSVEFNVVDWFDHERNAIRDVLEIIRFRLVHQNPKLIEYIANPTFDMLMYVNNLVYL